MSVRQRKSVRLTQGFGNLNNVARPPSAKRRQTQIGNDADSPSEHLGDETVNSGAEKHIMQLADNPDVDMNDLLDACDYVVNSEAGWAQYDSETGQFY